MELSIGIHSLLYGRHFSPSESCEILLESGFNTVDFPLSDFENETTLLFTPDFEKEITSTRSVLESNGIRIGQTHLPYLPSHTKEYLKGTSQSDYYKLYADLLKRSVELTAALNCKFAVLHLQLFDTIEEMKTYNLGLIEELLPVCEKCGVNLSLENIFNYRNAIIPSGISYPEDQVFFIDNFSGNYLSACLDSGHAMIFGVDPVEAVRTLGSRLGCLHLNSNDGVNDLHMIPYSRGYAEKTDWAAMMKALAEIGYKGTLNLELSCPPILPKEGVKYFYMTAGAAARGLAQFFNDAK